MWKNSNIVYAENLSQILSKKKKKKIIKNTNKKLKAHL